MTWTTDPGETDQVEAQRFLPSPGELRFSSPQFRVEEGERAVTLAVERIGFAGDVSVAFRTEEGTAAVREDFVRASGRLSWLDGDTAPRSLTVELADDGVQEGREAFRVVLEDPSGGAELGDPAAAEALVIDDDGRPVALSGDERLAPSAPGRPSGDPSLAMAADGRYAVVWEERERDGTFYGRFLQFFEPDGRAAGEPLDLRAHLGESYLHRPLVWMPDGRLLVSFSGGGALLGRFFDPEAGLPVGESFRIDSLPARSHSSPSAAVDSRGGLVIAWETSLADAAPGSAFGFDVVFRRFDEQGRPLGPENFPYSNRSGFQSEPRVAAWPDGSFVVAWHGQAFELAGRTAVFARRFDERGVPEGPEEVIDETRGDTEDQPSVAVDAAGGYLIVWHRQVSSVDFDVMARAFDRAGNPRGPEFRANTFIDGYQFFPWLAALAGGGFVAVWESGERFPPIPWESQDGDGSGIYGQRFDGLGRPLGAEFPVNRGPSGAQWGAVVAGGGAGGRFVVAWNEVEDDDSSNLELRRFASTTPCELSSEALCLGGRFRVTTSWRTQAGEHGAGRAVQLTEDTGVFSFFDESNLELVVKTLDACSFNDRFWVFAGGLTDVEVEMVVTDTATGTSKVYRNPQKAPFQPLQDTSAFATCAAEAPGGPPIEIPPPGLRPDPACGGGADALCLGGRFRVEVAWKREDGETGVGRPVRLTGDTGVFWFFDEANLELVVKALDACTLNDRFWIFAGGLTDVETAITVTDTRTGIAKTYDSPQKVPFRPLQDTDAFATCEVP